MDTKEIHQTLSEKFDTDKILIVNEKSYQPALQIPVDIFSNVCQFLYEDELFFFDFLACLTGIDNGIEKNTMEVIYHLTSIPYQKSIILKVILPREKPSIPSMSGIWQTANWHEREAFDLIGIQFENHPDLRRILLPQDWEGHPLRKDYQEQALYHGIKVKY